MLIAQHRLQSLQRVFPNAHHVARLQNKLGITSNYSSWCAVHWDGKFLHDVTGIDINKVHRLPVLVTSLVDESTQASFLESKKLASYAVEKDDFIDEFVLRELKIPVQNASSAY